MFVDEVTVSLKAGNGGNGCASFRRLRHQPKGGPDGGNGGRGGSVVLICDANTSDLTACRYQPQVEAQSGQGGRGNDQNGRRGKDCLLKLPQGTVVYGKDTGRMVTELTEDGQRVTLIEGGRGGRGNLSFKSSINRSPSQSAPGEIGAEGRYRFILKSIADVGLVGFPNAGKSTLTNLITHSQLKTAAYPFTTLNPHVAVIDYPDHFDRILLADIPGLIAGAHSNRGLGHRFLRHIERCRVLLLILDMAGSDGRLPTDDYAQLLEELGLYSDSLLKKDRLVTANKMDLPDAQYHLDRFRECHDVPVIPISCIEERGIAMLKNALRANLRAPGEGRVEPELC